MFDAAVALFAGQAHDLAASGSAHSRSSRTGFCMERGGIRFDDETIVACPARTIVRRGLVQVPEGRALFTKLTVEENLAMGGFVHSRAEVAGRAVAGARAADHRTIFEAVETLNRDAGLTVLLVEQNAQLALRMANYRYRWR